MMVWCSRGGRGGCDSGELALVVPLRLKIEQVVRRVRRDEEKRMVVSGRSGDGSPRRKRGRGGGAVATPASKYGGLAA